MSPRTRRWFEEYAAAHRHPMNRWTHKVAIPVIVFHIFAMLDWFPLSVVGGVSFTVGHVAWVAASTFWIALLPVAGGLLAAATAPMLLLAPLTPRSAVVALAVVGWVVQLAGHRIWEKNRPAFADNLLQALVGPVFFVATAIGAWPERRSSDAG